MMYYLGVMQWLIRGFAWFFFKIMNISGAEAVVAAASPSPAAPSPSPSPPRPRKDGCAYSPP